VSHFFPRALRIQGRERRPFFWMLSFFILIFLFMAIFRTYVDAAFVKHSGPQQIPLMLLINGVITIAVFWFIGFLGKPPDCPLVAWFMIGSALLTGAMFGLVLRGSGLAYPILYQLLNLQDSFFLVYLWSIAGTLFDVRQGKRLFPLLMAGQVLGTAAGSFLVAPLARLAGPDSPLAVAAVAYACIGVGLLITASAFVSRAGRRTVVEEETNKRPAEILSLIRKYPIIRYLTANAFYPSILLPVFTYQFFVIAHATFESQQALLTFLGVFRGATTLITFVLLFAVGRFYAKVGLARAAFVHPVNFAIVFAGLAASFGIFVAAYGQFSVLFVQRAIAGPINKILFDAVPRRLIKWSRVFTGGTVVNGAVILSALAMVLLQKVLSAHDLAYVGVVFALFWIYETNRFRQRFTTGLRQVLTDRAIDYEGHEAESAAAPDIPCGEGHGGSAARGSAARGSAARGSEARLRDELSADPEKALALLDDPDARIRAQAAASFAGNPDARGLNPLIEKLDDLGIVRRAAIEALAGYVDHFRPFLEVALLDALPQVQQGILEAMGLSDNKCVPLTFVRHETAKAYQRLQMIECLEAETSCLSLDMLKDHLRQDNDESLRLILHATTLQHLGDTRLILEALHTAEAAVAIELLENTLPPEIARLVLTLVDDVPAAEKIERGRSYIVLRQPLDLGHIVSFLGTSPDPTTRMLAAFVSGEQAPDDICLPAVQRLVDDPSEHVREAAAYAIRNIAQGDAFLPETVFDIDALTKTTLFDGVSIRGMEAIASTIQQKFYRAGSVIVGEGDEVHSIYCIISGTADVFRHHGKPDQTLVRTLADGAVIGETPLFTSHPSQDACVVTSEFIELYAIDFDDMRHIMTVYPQVVINAAAALALRLEDR